MQELFRKKSSDFNMIQDGMKKIKEFEQKKDQMEQELSDVRRTKNKGSKASYVRVLNATNNNYLFIS